MAKVIITKILQEEILRKFKSSSEKIFLLMRSLEKSPHKGKIVGNVGGIIIKEIKYGKFRFYFITDGFMLKFATKDELAKVIIKFVSMSDKKNQQEIINKVKKTLHSLGFESI